MKEKELQFCGATDRGKVRERNEDTFIAGRIWGGKYTLLVAVDGCGGYEGGEVAAAAARDAITEYLSRPAGEIRLEQLRKAVVRANNRVWEMRATEERLANMGCVLTAAIVDEEYDMLFIAHVGDTRCYVYDGADLRKVTKDHSPVGQLVDLGYLTEEEAMNHPSRHIINRMIGERRLAEGEDFVDTAIVALPSSYTILLCSDGLTDCVTEREIAEVLDLDPTPEGRAKRLIEAANAKGGRDNITVVTASK